MDPALADQSAGSVPVRSMSDVLKLNAPGPPGCPSTNRTRFQARIPGRRDPAPLPGGCRRAARKEVLQCGRWRRRFQRCRRFGGGAAPASETPTRANVLRETGRFPLSHRCVPGYVDGNRPPTAREGPQCSQATHSRHHASLEPVPPCGSGVPHGFDSVMPSGGGVLPRDRLRWFARLRT